MRELFNKYNVKITDEQLEKFREYYKILTEFNSKFNITTVTEEKDVYIKHFLDSVLFSDLFTSGKVIDIGSGGGFPAVPLKIINDNLDITMVEATGKKCEYLSYLIEKLQLKNIKVINKRAEELAFCKEYREKFDYVTARAVAQLNILCEYCIPFIKIGGKFIAYKSCNDTELEDAKKSINVLGGKLVDTVDKNVENFLRRAVIIEKIKNTDKIYPRSNGKIRKNPII